MRSDDSSNGTRSGVGRSRTSSPWSRRASESPSMHGSSGRSTSAWGASTAGTARLHGRRSDMCTANSTSTSSSPSTARAMWRSSRRLSEDLNSKRLSDAHRKEIRQAYRKATRRLLLFDYDGTLVSLSAHRETALPDDRVMGILKGLVSDSTNHVVLVSGRPRRDLGAC